MRMGVVEILCMYGCHQYMKPYYAELMRLAAGAALFAPVYLTPGSRYHYQSPAFLRHDVERKKDLNTSPFLSMWVRAMMKRERCGWMFASDEH
jgi:hypothetical protein